MDDGNRNPTSVAGYVIGGAVLLAAGAGLTQLADLVIHGVVIAAAGWSVLTGGVTAAAIRRTTRRDVG